MVAASVKYLNQMDPLVDSSQIPFFSLKYCGKHVQTLIYTIKPSHVKTSPLNATHQITVTIFLFALKNRNRVQQKSWKYALVVRISKTFTTKQNILRPEAVGYSNLNYELKLMKMFMSKFFGFFIGTITEMFDNSFKLSLFDSSVIQFETF